MLYHVKMTVKLPTNMDPQEAAEIKAREKAYSEELQEQGIWRHIWRVAGLYENVSIFDCRDHLHLHEVLTGLPLYPWMEMHVMPLCRHPSSVRGDDA